MRHRAEGGWQDEGGGGGGGGGGGAALRSTVAKLDVAQACRCFAEAGGGAAVLGYDAARRRNLLTLEQTKRLLVLLALTKYALLVGLSNGDKVRLLLDPPV